MTLTDADFQRQRDNLAVLVDIFPPSLQAILDQVVTVNREILEKPLMQKLAALLEKRGAQINSVADLQIAVTCLHDHPIVLKGLKRGTPPIISIIELLGGELEEYEKLLVRHQSLTSNALQKQYSKTVTRVLKEEGLFDDDNK